MPGDLTCTEEQVRWTGPSRPMSSPPPTWAGRPSSPDCVPGQHLGPASSWCMEVSPDCAFRQCSVAAQV